MIKVICIALIGYLTDSELNMRKISLPLDADLSPGTKIIIIIIITYFNKAC